METLEVRLQRRIHTSLYALLFLTVLLGISVILEGCAEEKESRKTPFHDYSTVGFYSGMDPVMEREEGISLGDRTIR